MKKTNYIFIGIIVLLLAVLCFFIWKYIKPANNKDKDAIRFSEEYTKVPEDNVFDYVSATKVIDILKNGTGVVYLGFPECGWCQQYVVYLNEVAKENGIDTIYYYNIKDARTNNTESYKKITELLKYYLFTDDEGNERVYVPDVTFVKDGVIVGHDNETSIVTDEDGTPETYWTSEKVSSLKSKLANYINLVKETVCTNCN